MQGRGWRFVAAAGLLVAVWMAFWPAVHNGFVAYDDPQYVTKNALLRQPISFQWFTGLLTERVAGNWHPLTLFSHAVDVKWFGDEPLGHHLVSLILHSVTSVWLFWVMVRLAERAGGAFEQNAVVFAAVVAGSFAIHPLRVESVVWISERKDVLSGLFFVACLSAYLKYVREPHWRTFRWVVAAFALGLLAKSMLVTVPFVLLLLDAWPLRRAEIDGKWVTRRWMRLVAEKWPLWLLTIAVSIVTIVTQRETGTLAGLDTIPLVDRLANIPVAYAIYLRQFLWPEDLACYYPHPSYAGGVSWPVVGLATLGLLVATVLVLRSRRPYLMVGWLWYLGMLVPVIGLVQVGMQSHADRYTYLPSIGLGILVGGLVVEAMGHVHARRFVLGILGLAAVAWILVSQEQSRVWRSTTSLAQHTIRVAPEGDVGHYLLATEAYDRLEFVETLGHLERALERNPRAIDSQLLLGQTQYQLGRLDEAEATFRLVTEKAPRLTGGWSGLAAISASQGRFTESLELLDRAEGINPMDPNIPFNRGKVYLAQGRIQDAVAAFEQTLRLDPPHLDARYHLGLALTRAGRLEEAERELHHARRQQPDDALFCLALGNLAIASGNLADAMEWFERGCGLPLHGTMVQNQFAWILATHPTEGVRDGSRAVELAKRLVEIDSKNPLLWDTYAAALAEAKRFPEAIQAETEAIRIAQTSGMRPHALEEFQSRLTLYQKSIPYREGPTPTVAP